MIALRFLLVVSVALVHCAGVPAQPAPQTGRIPTVTRLVKIFYELESALQTQARSGDPAALEQSLDPSFEMRDGAFPGAPIPRDEWIRQARATAAENRSFDQMAVHDLGPYAIVSFREVGPGAKTGAQRFVVDCWKRDGDTWKLAIRYASDVAATAKKGTPAGTLDKRF